MHTDWQGRYVVKIHDVNDPPKLDSVELGHVQGSGLAHIVYVAPTHARVHTLP
jgi:hypothetical protein